VKEALVGCLERALLAAVFAGTAAGLLLAVRNGLAPAAGRGSFGLAFWGLLVAAYVAVAVAVWAASAAVAAAARRPGLARWPIAAGAALFAVLVPAANPRAALMVFELAGGDRFRWLSAAALVFAFAGLAVAAGAPLARRNALRALAAVAAGLAWLALSPPSASPAAGAAAAPRPRGQPFVVIGIDGADWRFVDPLIARGALPNLADLRARGAWGPLRTLSPTVSPAIWTTMATGARPQRHGVRGFEAVRLQGIDETLPDLHPLRGLGVRRLMEELRESGRIAPGPVSSASRRVPAFWNIATAFGTPVGVVAWWATAPADAVLGHLVSDRLYYEALVARGRPLPAGLAHPDALAGRAAADIVLPEAIRHEDARAFLDVTPEEFEVMRRVVHPSPLTGIAHEFTYYLSVFETHRRLALRVLEEERQAFGAPGDLLVLFRIVDKTCHTALHLSELVDEHPGASPDDRRKFGRVVTGAYRAADAAVGDIRKAFPEANVIVVSDHGFQMEDGGYNHTRAPDGVFLGAGPAFRPGRVDGLSVYDVMPLLLYLKGFPLAEDLPGTLPAAALDPELLRQIPPTAIATYRDGYAARRGAGTREADAEIHERLRALGYVQ
jgi:hypothetical protein